MKSKEGGQASNSKNSIMKVASSFWKMQEQQLEVGVYVKRKVYYIPIFIFFYNPL